MHRPLQRVHGVAGLLAAPVLDVDGERHLAPRHRHEPILDRVEGAGDHGEEIGWLRERIVPDREMAVGAGDVAALDRIAVGEQGLRQRLRRLDAGRVDGEHVGPVVEIGDAAEALRLALGAPVARGAIEPHQLGVLRRPQPRRQRQPEGPGRRRLQREAPLARLIGRRRQGGAVEVRLHQPQFVAVEHQRRPRRGAVARREGGFGDHHRLRLVEPEIEMHRVDPIGGGDVVDEADDFGPGCL